MLDSVRVQEVRWEGGGIKPVREYKFFYRKGHKNKELGTGLLVYKRIISAVKRVEFVSDRVLMAQQRIKLMMRRTAPTRNWNVFFINSLKKILHGLSPRANYTDRATTTCRRSDCQLLRIEGATWSA
jgi:hypothetical protein